MNEQAEAANVASAIAKMVNPVTMENGEIEDFGKNGQIKREFVFSEGKGVTIRLKLITGTFKEVFIGKDNQSYDLLAARGATEYLSNSVAGIYSDKEGIHPEDFELAVDQALEQLASGELSTRRASENLKGYGDLIRALVENRQTSVNEDGTPKFTEEQASYAVVKAIVLSAPEEDNKIRMKIPGIAARIEGYKLERQAAKKAKADAKVTPVTDDLAELL